MAAAPSRWQNGTLDSWIDSAGPTAKRRKFENAATALFPCLVCKEPFRRRADLWEHLTSKEKGINVFVCLDCHRGFCKERLLRTHSCELANAEEENDDNPMALSVFCHIMACEECGLCVALVNTENPSWKSYSALCAHPTRSFRKITLYTWTPASIRFIKSDLSIPFNVRIDFGPAVTNGVPISCELCGQRYSGVDDIEKHALEVHQDQCPPMQCQFCSSKYASPLRMELHVNEKHGRGKWDVTDFLKSAPVVEPYLEKAVVGRTDSYVFCDLCQLNFLGNKFNEHDCVVNYMRRYLLNGKVIFCPAVNLPECNIDMSIQDPLLVSLTEKVQRHLELCLRFFIPVVAPKVDDFKSDQVYSCKHCERIIISPALFREHVIDALQEQRVDFEWPKADSSGQDLLLHFGAPITITEAGFVCPRSGCSNTSCSTVGLELHMRSVHEDTFQRLTIPTSAAASAVDAAVDQRAERSCLVCREKGFRSRSDLQAHVRDWHVHPCDSCGSCLVSQARLEYHKQTSACNGRFDGSSPLNFCPICKEVFQLLSDYYCHLIVQHPSYAAHDETYGVISPSCCFFLQVKDATKTDHSYNNCLPKPSTVIKKRELTVMEEAAKLVESVMTMPAESVSMDDDVQVVEPPENNDVLAPNVRSDDVDDEVAILETEPGSTTGRQPTHGCHLCSQKFYTALAAEEHRKTHDSDAGMTTEEVLPVPPNTYVYLCRLCCLAYELYSAYAEHMQKHRQILDCNLCNAVCLNPQYFEKHMESHKSKSLIFGCPTCFKAFRTDMALMLHLNQAHGCPLLWYCHSCGLACGEWRQMSPHKCKESLTDQPVIIPTTRRRLHFQPRRNSDTVNPSTSAKVTDVSECCHRSFLACQESGIACSDCGTIIPVTFYQSPTGGQNKGEDRLTLVEEAVERALISVHPFSKRMKPSFDVVMAIKTVKVLLPKMNAQRTLLPATSSASNSAPRVTAARPLLPAPPLNVPNRAAFAPKMVDPRRLLPAPLNSLNVVALVPKATGQRPLLPAPSNVPSTSTAAIPSTTTAIRNVNSIQQNFF